MDERMENGEYKLGVESRLSKVEAKLAELATNHIPHLELKIEDLVKKLDRLSWLIITTLLAVLLNLLSRLFKINV